METIQGAQETLVGQGVGQEPSTLTDKSADEVSAQQGINFRPLLRILRRNAGLVVGVAALTTGLAYWRSSLADPVYQSSFRLLVEPVTPEKSLSEPGVVARGREEPRQNELDYATQVVILKSSNLMSDVVKQVQDSYPEFNAGQLLSGLTIRRCCVGDGVGGTGNEDTRIIEVLYKDSDPSRAQLVAETTANRFLQYSLEERKSGISEGVRFIDDQLPALEERVSSLQSQLQVFQEQYLLTDPQTQGGQLSTQLTEIANQKLETEKLLREQVTLYQNLQKQLGLGPSQAIASSTLSEDPGYQNLLRKREEVESQIAIQLALYNEASPVIQNLRGQQQELSALQEKRAQEVLGPAIRELSDSQKLAFQNSIRTQLIQQMVNSANEIQVLQARASTLNQASNLLSQRLQQFPAIARRYADLQRELQLATQTLDRLLAQRETLKVEAAQSEFPWDLIASPQIPKDKNGNPVPLKGKLPRNMALGLLLGLVAGTGSAILLERSKDVFLSLEDLEEGLPLPLLAAIPYCQEVSRLEHASTSLDLEKSNRRGSANLDLFVDSFNALYSKLRLSLSTESIRSLVVSSPSAKDGKSTLALNLAKAALMANQRVLLVDANFQSPQISQMLDLNVSPGLSDVLMDKADLEAVIEPVPSLENLFVLTTGQALTGSRNLLASPEMKRLAGQLKLMASFDLVIYDTSSFQESTDAGFLASYGSPLLMVVRLCKTSRSASAQVARELEDLQLPCLGIVANYV